MELGAFSISLAVKDIEASRRFYERCGGLGRFPVTLYFERWVRLLDSADALRAFLDENKGKLRLKGQE